MKLTITIDHNGEIPYDLVLKSIEPMLSAAVGEKCTYLELIEKHRLNYAMCNDDNEVKMLFTIKGATK